mmetsp:Transcript_11665/g.32484  ORF Transcript_11665/g.32484 Transcript_11665/m.32484 type:complete len:99 (-) Transcript_11665:40-336(-)
MDPAGQFGWILATFERQIPFGGSFGPCLKAVRRNGGERRAEWILIGGAAGWKDWRVAGWMNEGAAGWSQGRAPRPTLPRLVDLPRPPSNILASRTPPN